MGATEVGYVIGAIKRDIKSLNFKGAAEKLTALKRMTENPVLQEKIDGIIARMKGRELEIQTALEKELSELELEPAAR